MMMESAKGHSDDQSNPFIKQVNELATEKRGLGGRRMGAGRKRLHQGG